MTMPFYVSPEQAMKDKADYARKGIARGRSVVVLAYNEGILFVAENPSRSLHKISEIYDRIAFAAVGKYNEFENLRIGGVRYADLRGFTYDRADMTLAEAVKLGKESLARDNNGGEREVTADQLEVALLDRSRVQPRKFKRVLGSQLRRLLGEDESAGGSDASSSGGDAEESSDDTSEE